MSASDNEFEQYSNKLNDILSMGAATARVSWVRTVPIFFENLTLDPPIIIIVYICINSLQIEPYHIFNPGGAHVYL